MVRRAPHLRGLASTRFQVTASWTAGDLSQVLAGRYELGGPDGLLLYLAADRLTVASLEERLPGSD